MIELGDEDKKGSKDDWGVAGTTEYGNNNYWKVPE